MADQEFIVACLGVEKAHLLNVEASNVIEEGSCLKITGDKGTLWISKEAFLYALPAPMLKASHVK